MTKVHAEISWLLYMTHGVQYTVIQKRPPFYMTVVSKMFTDFYNIWHTVYSVNVQHNRFIYSNHLLFVATLLCETLMLENSDNLRHI